MSPADAIRAILKEAGKAPYSFSRELGITPQALDNRLRGGMTVTTLVSMASTLGFKVILVPSDKTTEGYEIDE